MMSNYDELYNGKPPYVKESDTSKEAAESVSNSALSIRSRVYAFIGNMGAKGATCWEVEVDLTLSHQTASARIRELSIKGQIGDSGYRRRTGSNRNAIVWVQANLSEFVKGPVKTLQQRLKDAEIRIGELETENKMLKVFLETCN